MIEFGKTLRQAREAKGLTIAQVADTTHMMSQIVEGLENENFSRIVAPIYGRGFVKLYCEAVGLDPKEPIAAFMELYGGTRTEEPVPVREAPPPPEAPAPAPVEPAKPAETLDTLFSQPAPDAQGRTAETEQPKPVGRRAFKIPEMSLPEVPPSLWRMATLVAIAIVVIWVAFIGVRALYRATMTAPETPTATSAATVQPEKKAATPQAEAKPDSAAKATGRKPMRIPPLYID